MTWIKDGAVERPTHFAENKSMPDRKLKSAGITLDGTPIALRPLLPEDEPALQDLFAHMSREDVRLRFFTPMRELKHALAARLSHLDDSHEMALVAQRDGMTLGVARYSADPDRRSAEFAVAVRMRGSRGACWCAIHGEPVGARKATAGCHTSMSKSDWPSSSGR